MRGRKEKNYRGMNADDAGKQKGCPGIETQPDRCEREVKT